MSIPDNGNFCEFQTGSFEPVVWAAFGFNADPDLAFYLNADPDTDPDPGSQTKADPGGFRSGSWSDIWVTKNWILHDKYTYRT